jgi:hypothetical protein
MVRLQRPRRPDPVPVRAGQESERPMTDNEERAFVLGSEAVYREMLGTALRGLHRADMPRTLGGLGNRIARLEAERADVVAVLRRLCAAHGDNDWDTDLHLSDALDKHLGRYLEGSDR